MTDAAIIGGFPILYKKTSTGAIQTWRIHVNGANITVEHGQLNGAIQVATETIKAGKNQGKANATTAETQAKLEANAKFTKQLKKGYCKSLQEAEAGATDEVIEGGVNPMLAHKYKDHSGKIKFPCYAQPKLDGIRCIAIIEPSGKVTLWSRTRKPINSVPHINKELSKLAGNKTIVLDGEAYASHLNNDFERIVSLVRQQTPAEGHEAVQYHVYDMVSDEDFRNRTLIVKALLENVNPSIIVTVSTIVLKNKEELEEKMSEFIEAGYEGLMARNSNGGYENKRSYNLQKVKIFQDDEFPISKVESGRGKREGQAVVFCLAPNGTEFGANPKGTDEHRKDLLKRAKELIGKKATIRFQDYTAYGVPRFPVMITVRDYE